MKIQIMGRKKPHKTVHLFNFGSVGVVPYSGAGFPDDVTITTDEEADRGLVEWGKVTDT